MSGAPARFHAELRAHNRQAFLLTILSVLAAVLAWNLAYFFFALILLGLTTAAQGDFGGRMPPWIPGAALALAGVLLVWGTIDASRRRFARLTDRPIIGWHLIPDFLLLPVRLTFAIGGNFAAIRRLPAGDVGRAWDLLLHIHQLGRARLQALSLVESNPDDLHRFLETLQILRYIDLHPGDDGWFFTVRSTRQPELRALIEES